MTTTPRAALVLLYALVAVLAAATGLTSSPGPVSVAAADASYPAGQFDAPAEGATIVGSVDVSGWSIDVGASTGTGVDRVQVYLDGTLRGTATYGLTRADIAAGYGARFGPSGYRYTLDLAGVSAGAHTVTTRARSTVSGTEMVISHNLTVQLATYPSGRIDSPSDGATVSGSVTVNGWAIDEAATTGTGVDRVRILLDGAYRGDATYGLQRPDVGAGYGSRFTPSGYTYVLDLAGVAIGTHTVETRARSTVTGAENSISRTISVTLPPTGTPTPSSTSTPTPGVSAKTGYPAGSVDDPAEGAVVTGSVALTGWAIDVGATGDGTTGVDRVRVYLDGSLLGDATYNRSRPDIASSYGAQFGPSGFRYLVDTSGLAPGSHRLEARAHSTVTNTETVYPRNVGIAVPTATPATPATPTPTSTPVGYPAGGLDSPSDGLTVTGSVALSGWAIDQAAPTGTGVDKVRVFLDGAYRADAQYGLARPDIAAGYGSRFGASGYSYTLNLTGIATGSHTLEARAHSLVTGLDTVARRTIVVASAGDPRGGIEQPAQAAQVSASTTIAVSGYALDAAAPTGTGVDRVRVLLDGVYRGDAQYGLSRPDVAAGYGARFDPTGYRYSLDLSGLTAGTHYVEARAHSTVNGAEAPYIHSIVVSTGPTPTPTTLPAASPRFGANTHVLYAGLDRATTDLDRVRAAGFGLARIDVQWDHLEPTQGTLDDGYLAKLDAVLDLAYARGVRPILVVLGTPAWARDGLGSRLTPPSRPDDYASALGRLAAHYAGRYPTQPALAYEIWNEPNQVQFWDAPGGPNPIAYAALLKATYPRVKAADPRAPVLGGSIAFNDRDFLEDLYTQGGIAGSFDGLALHPYSAANDPNSAGDGYHSFRLAVEQLGQIMAAHGESGKPIWITEMGWSTNTISDATRASYYQQAVTLVKGWPQVVAFCAYQLSQDQDRPDYGLVATDGTQTASWQAYAGAVAAP